MKSFNKDKVIALICLVFGAVYMGTALTLPPTNLANDPGPKIFPVLGSGIVMLSSAAILLKRYEGAPKAAYTREQWGKAIQMFAVFVVYAVLLWLVGYLVATPLALFVTSFMFTDEGVKIALWKRILFAVIVTAVLYWIFAKVLIMLLPVGILFG